MSGMDQDWIQNKVERSIRSLETMLRASTGKDWKRGNGEKIVGQKKNQDTSQESSDSSNFTSGSNDELTSHACVTQHIEISHPKRNLRGEASDLRILLLHSGAWSHLTPYLEYLEDMKDSEDEVFLPDE